MKEGRIIEPEKIHIVNLQTQKGNIEGVAGNNKVNIKGHSYECIAGIGIDASKNLVGIELTIDIEAINESDEKLGISGSYTHEIVFRVENLNDFLEIHEDGSAPSIDFLMNATLTGIAFSTVRGIIFSRTQGTSLGTVILPVVDPKKIVGDNTSVKG